MEEISYIVVDGIEYEVSEGTTVNINGKQYTVEQLLRIANVNDENQEQTMESPVEIVRDDESTDVSYIVLNGKRYSVDDEQATSDLQKLQDSIAQKYSEYAQYYIGDYCIHDGYVYSCVQNIETPEPWTEEHWQLSIVSDEIQSNTSYRWGSGLNYNQETNLVSVDTVDDAIEFDTRPITSNGVWKEIGNVAILLGTI